MKNCPSISKNSRLLLAICGCILAFSLFSCKKDKESVPAGEEKINLAAADLEGYYLVTENNGWNPRMSLFYFEKTGGKLMLMHDGAGLRRGYEVVVKDNHLKIGSDGQTFDFLFEKTSEGSMLPEKDLSSMLPSLVFSNKKSNVCPSLPIFK